MIKTICDNLLTIFGTICIICIFALISYGIITFFIEEFGIKLPWRYKNGNN